MTLKTMLERKSSLKKILPIENAKATLSILTREEINIINTTKGMDSKDYEAIAQTKLFITNPSAKKFDRYIPKNPRHYQTLQTHWLENECWLLGQRLHHKPSPHELFEDFKTNKNGLRFKIFYCLRYPDKVKRIE